MAKLLTHKWLLLALLVASLAGRMLLTNQHFYTHDDIQVFRVNEFINCFKEGQFPCRWSANLGKGYGYPWFNYYPPMIYVVPSLLHLVGFSIVTSLNLFMFLTFLLAAWSIYALVKELLDREDLAFLASALYTLYPFHAINVFVRGVYAENLAWSIAPFILLVIYRQLKSNKFQKLLPALFAFIYLTHIISSFVLTGLAFAWATLLIFVYKKSFFKNISRLLFQAIIGLGLAAFFIVPALAEKNLVRSDSLTQGYYAHTNHYVSFFQLFKEYKWNYSASLWSEAWDEMPFMVGHIHTILLGILFVLLVYFRPKKSGKNLWLIAGLLTLTAGFLFLAHFKSDFIWTLIPPLAYVQFPWRFIVWAALPLVLALSLLLSLLPKKLSYFITLLTSITLLIYSYPFFFPRGYDTYTDIDYLSGSQYREQQTKSLFDYLPLTVHTIPLEHATDSDFPIKIFYFPGWNANVPIQADPIYGFIEPINHGATNLILKWRETPFRLAMDILSFISLVGYLMYNKVYVKKRQT